MAVSKRLRYEILRRDSNTCRYCGQSAPDVKLTVDHVVPTALGGSDAPSNLVAACKDCNAGKSASAPDAAIVADVDQRAVQWAQAMNVAVERRMAELARDRARVSRFDEAWRSYHVRGHELPRDLGWKSSVLRFMSFGLDDEFLADAVATAMGNPKPALDEVWKYFCGICWREIKDLQASVALPDTSSGEEEGGEFPFMELFGVVLDDILQALRVDERIAKIARGALWDGMSEANKVWLAGLVGDDAEIYDSQYEQVMDFISSYIARDMYEINFLSGEGQAVDGS